MTAIPCATVGSGSCGNWGINGGGGGGSGLLLPVPPPGRLLPEAEGDTTLGMDGLCCVFGVVLPLGGLLLNGGNWGMLGMGLGSPGTLPAFGFGETVTSGCTGTAANGSVRPLEVCRTRASGGGVRCKPLIGTVLKGCCCGVARGLAKGGVALGAGCGGGADATGVGDDGLLLVPPPSSLAGHPANARANMLTHAINET